MVALPPDHQDRPRRHGRRPTAPGPPRGATPARSQRSSSDSPSASVAFHCMNMTYHCMPGPALGRCVTKRRVVWRHLARPANRRARVRGWWHHAGEVWREIGSPSPRRVRAVRAVLAEHRHAVEAFFGAWEAGSAGTKRRLASDLPIAGIQEAAIDHPDPWLRRWCIGFLDHHASDALGAAMAQTEPRQIPLRSHVGRALGVVARRRPAAPVDAPRLALGRRPPSRRPVAALVGEAGAVGETRVRAPLGRTPPHPPCATAAAWVMQLRMK